MEQYAHKTFIVHVKICKSTSGNMEGSVDYEEVLRKIKTGIAESVAICAGVINSYLIGEILDVKDEKKDEKKEGGYYG